MKWLSLVCALLCCSVTHAQEVCEPDPVVMVEPDLPRDATRAEIEQRCSEIMWELNALYWEYALLNDQLIEAETLKESWSIILRALSRDTNSSDAALIEAAEQYNHWALEVIRLSGRMAWILNRTSSLLLEWTRLQERLSAM